jgi:cation transport protein ChaC
MHGVHRALCVHSWVHRGTQDRPGLVLGLDRGGSCRGVAFRVAPADRDDVLAYLRQRELVTQVYVETWRRARLSSGDEVSALVYVVDRQHPQYAGRMLEDDIASIVRTTEGRSGRNLDYVLNTIAHLRESGVHDPHLEAVAERLSG